MKNVTQPRNRQIKVILGKKVKIKTDKGKRYGDGFSYFTTPTLLECDGVQKYFSRRLRRKILRCEKTALIHFPKNMKKIRAK